MSEIYGVQTYRKRPVEVRALRWTGANLVDMIDFLGNPRVGRIVPVSKYRNELILHMPGGDITVPHGDWVIRGNQGGYHPCGKESFAQVYEYVPSTPIDDSNQISM